MKLRKISITSLALFVFIPTLLLAKGPIVVPQSLIEQVEEGNAEAAYFIASKLLESEVEEDNNKAEEWMTKAANMEYPQAMFELGEMLSSKEMQSEALDWFLKAIEYGHAKSLGSVALYHYNGFGGLEKDSEKDCKTSYDYFKKAVIKDDQSALNNYSWFLATSANHRCRHPERALKVFSKLKKKFSNQTRNMPWQYQDTEAAVLAAIADFDAAINIQSQLIESINESGQNSESFVERLMQFQQRKPWIEQNEE